MPCGLSAVCATSTRLLAAEADLWNRAKSNLRGQSHGQESAPGTARFWFCLEYQYE